MKTANSIKSQDFDDFEYIIKDGGSDSETSEIAESIQPDRLVFEADKGIFDAMNQALELCSGAYVNFMNAGDIFHNRFVLSRINSIISKKTGIEDVPAGTIVVGNLARSA